MEVALLHNSKAGDSEFTPVKLVRLLRKEGYKATHFPLKEALEDKGLFRKVLAHSETLVVAGGDGSIRKVAIKVAGSKHVIAPLPIGTANNIALSLGIKGTPAEVAAGWSKGQKRKIDLGIASGPWGKKYFIEGVGLGLIGRTIAVIEDLDAASGRVFANKDDRLHRDLCVMTALALEMSPTRAKLTIDDNKIVDDYLLLEILNINRAGPGMELAAAADPSDGKLDLVWATAGDRRALTQSIEKCLSESRYGPILTSRRLRKLRMSIERCELRMDDKVVLRSEDFSKWSDRRRIRIEIGVEPQAVRVLVPQIEKPKSD